MDSTEAHKLLQRLVGIDAQTLSQITRQLDAAERTNLLRKLSVLCKSLDETLPAAATSQKKPETNAICECPIPPEVIHQVCLSRFLTVQEQGRWLLLVSKSIGQYLGNDLLWKLLCCHRWQNSSAIPQCIMEHRGYEWFFRRRMMTNVDRPLLHLDTPTISAETLILLISIFNSKEQEIVSISLTGKELETLLQTGEMNISLLDPVLLGFHPIRKEDGMVEFDTFCTDFIHWKAAMHLLRTDRCQCATVHETRDCSWGEYDYCEDPSASVNAPASKMTLPLSGIDLTELKTSATKTDANLMPVEVDMGYLEFATQGLDLDFVGQAYVERLRRAESYANDALETIKIEPTLLCFTRDFDDSKRSVELAFSELRLDVWKTYRSGSAMLFNSQHESKRKKHGVTLLHLLDRLANWNAE